MPLISQPFVSSLGQLMIWLPIGPVGGIVVPVNRLGLVGLMVGVVSVLVVRRRRRA